MVVGCAARVRELAVRARGAGELLGAVAARPVLGVWVVVWRAIWCSFRVHGEDAIKAVESLAHRRDRGQAPGDGEEKSTCWFGLHLGFDGGMEMPVHRVKIASPKEDPQTASVEASV